MIASQQVLFAGNRYVATKRSAEHLEFALAQRSACTCRSAHGAMVLDQHDVVTIDFHLGHISFGRSLVGQASNSDRDASGADLAAILLGLALRPGGDHTREGFVAECRTNRLDEIEGQICVSIGEQRGRSASQLPTCCRTPAPAGMAIAASHNVGGLECLEVLADRSIGEIELVCQLASGGAVYPVQAVDDAALGIGQFDHNRSLANTQVDASITLASDRYAANDSNTGVTMALE